MLNVAKFAQNNGYNLLNIYFMPSATRYLIPIISLDVGVIIPNIPDFLIREDSAIFNDCSISKVRK